MKLSQESLGLHQELSTCPSHVNEVSGEIPRKLGLCNLKGRKHTSRGPRGLTWQQVSQWPTASSGHLAEEAVLSPEQGQSPQAQLTGNECGHRVMESTVCAHALLKTPGTSTPH